MKSTLKFLRVAVLGTVLGGIVSAADTPGTVTLTVQLSSAGGQYQPKHVVAVWVTHPTLGYIKCLWKDGTGWTGEGTRHLDQLHAARGSSTALDGYSGATITSYNLFTVTWNCRNADNSAVMPDGTYYFHVETTDRNSAGPYSGALSMVKGPSAFSTSYSDQTYIHNLSLVYTPSGPPHDIAVTSISPGSGITNTTVNVQVLVTNKTITVENNITVTLSNLTSSTLIGSQTITSLAANSATTLTFPWNTGGLPPGNYSLQVKAGPVAGETTTGDNTFNRLFALQDLFAHNVAVLSLSPSLSYTNANTTVQVVVTNKTSTTESFTVVLNNLTTSSLIGTQSANSLAGNTARTLNFTWNTLGIATGAYLLQATAGPVTGETNTADNTLASVVTLQDTPHDIAVTSLSPSSGIAGTTVNFQVVVTNRINTTEDDIAVTLVNQTSSTVLGSQNIVSLGANATATLTFPWNTAAVLPGNYSLQASAGSVAGETATADNTLTNSFHLQSSPVRDVAVLSLSVPAQVSPGTVTNVTVVVTNKGGNTESFAVVLTDLTTSRPIGTNLVSALAFRGSSVLTIPWAVPITNPGSHTLRATAWVVPGETYTSDNNRSITTTVLSSPMQMAALIAKGTVWRYHDLGIDLTDTPWKMPDYYDLTWSTGAAPLGYGLTNIATTLGYGPNASVKYPTYYFRKEFYADAIPASLILNVRRDDGVIFYLNGAELVRMNTPVTPVCHTNYFTTNDVTGTAQYTYFTTYPALTNLVVGRNVLAAELHQSAPTNSDLVLDVELLGPTAQFTAVHDVDVVSLSTPANALAGDRLPVTITLTNRGNVTETALVILKDTGTGQILGTQTISGLFAGNSTSVQIDWTTLGATNGTHSLQAFTVIAGVTNFAGAITGLAHVSGSGFGLKTATVEGSLGGRCHAVATNGSLLLVGAGSTLEVWDRSIPAVPATVGSVRLPGIIEDIVVSGGFAYAACGSVGVQFVDIRSPATPTHVNTYDTSGHASSLAVSGSYLYVADGVAGLRIVNIATPAAPSLAGAYYTAGPARAVAISGSIACVLDAHSGLLVLNVGNPAAPSLLGSYSGIDAGQDLAVAGSYAYVVDANNHFYVVDISNPASPTLANPASTLLLMNRIAESIVLNGSIAYVPAREGGLVMLDISAPSAPVFVGALTTPGQALAAAVAGTVLYLADGFHGFQVYDVSTPAGPWLLTDLPMSIRACDVAVKGNLAFVAAGERGLRICRLGNAAAPEWIGWFTGALNARCVAVSDSTAYVGDGQYGLKVVDATVSASPTLLGSWSGPNLSSIRNIGASGTLVVASDGSRVCLFDASTPASPSLVATYTSPAFAFDMTVAGGRAYLACGNAGFIILDIGASTLTPLSTNDTPGFATGIAVSGNTAYVADGANGWLIYDVSNPAAPALVTANTEQGPVSSVAASAKLVTLGNDAHATTMDVTKPLTPVTSQNFAGLTRPSRIAAVGGQAYVSENEAGLAVLNAPLILQFARAGGGSTQFTLAWISKPGKTYAIYESVDMPLGPPTFTLVQENIPATPPLNSVVISNAGNEMSCFLIREQ